MLRKLKAEATRNEKARVFNNMNTPRDIVVYHNGRTYIRRAWRNPSGYFGWDKWVEF